jgi:hypothetical protein
MKSITYSDSLRLLEFGLLRLFFRFGFGFGFCRFSGGLRVRFGFRRRWPVSQAAKAAASIIRQSSKANVFFIPLPPFILR